MFNFDFLLNRKKQIFFIFLICFLLGMISFTSFNFPYLNYIAFFVLSLLILIVSIYKLEWGLYLILAEILLNAMGHLFYFEISEFRVSLRISFWFIFIFIFFVKIIIKFFKDKKIFNKIYESLIFKNNFLYLGLFIFIGLIFGLIKNDISDVFLDFNSWLYFALIFPLVYILKINQKDQSERIWQNIIIIFVAVILYLCFKSLLLLFLFSHNIAPLVSDIHFWTRRHYLAEITNMGDGVHRIFLQNQIFIFVALFFSFLSYLSTKSIKIKKYIIFFSSFLLATVIISFSRSFWLALILSFIFIIFICFYKYKSKLSLKLLLMIFSSFIFSLILIFVIIRFPLPDRTEVQFGIETLSDRANIVQEEPATASRWALLDVMLIDIKDNFLFGRGFGARLEYVSSDPRALANNPDGLYSSYAFEWAWLELIIKMGIFGFLAYLFLVILFLYKNFKLFLKSKNYIYLALLSIILFISIVNFFTPYLNHPLGIFYIIIVFLFFDFYQKQTNQVC